LILGDSLGDFSGNSLATECVGSTVVNAGVGGTTADDWCSGGMWDDAMGKMRGEVPSHVWLTLGGNDYLGAGCNAAALVGMADDLSCTIKSILGQWPGVKVLMTGYAVSSISNECPGKGPSDLKGLNDALVAVAGTFAINQVEVHITTSAVGASETTFADENFFRDDGIHPSEAGYKAIFGGAAVQAFFNCGADSTSGTPTPSPPSGPASDMCDVGLYPVLSDNGKCVGSDKEVTRFEDCETARDELDLTSKKVKSFTNSKRPIGCYFFKNRLWFNKGGKGLNSEKRKSVCCSPESRNRFGVAALQSLEASASANPFEDDDEMALIGDDDDDDDENDKNDDVDDSSASANVLVGVAVSAACVLQMLLG
jgi:hypothetical protein